MFFFHGMQKMTGYQFPMSIPFGTEIWFAGFIELVCGGLVMLGLLTRPAAFLASGEMAVAYFQGHWKFQGGANFFPVINHGETAVLYCFIFLAIACRGAGMWGVDKE
jgi:putative oxidoreductase